MQVWYAGFLAGCGFASGARNFPITTDNCIVQWELVKQGLGIGIVQHSVGDAEPTVTRALPHLDHAPGEMWLVAHRAQPILQPQDRPCNSDPNGVDAGEWTAAQ